MPSAAGPSIDPVVFFKLQLVMFFEGIRSERQLIETASLNLAHRWYLGYALDEDLPDHSSLTRIRQRLGIDIFQRFFEKIVDLCQEAGLVWGRELYFDATKVEANAGIPSLIPRFYYDATTHVADLFADEADDAAPQADTDLPPGIVPLPIDPESVPAEGDPPWRLLEERRLDPNRPSHRGYRRTSDFRVSPTDPDASPMWDWGAIRLGYHDHYVVDGGKRRIILAALVTPADVMESQAMRDLLWRVCFRRKIWPHHVTGDAKYGTTENIVAIEDAGIRAYVPLTDFAHRDRLLRAGRLHLRSRAGRVPLPAGPSAAPLRASSAPKASWPTAATPPSATPARSRPSAPPATTAARSSARSTSTTWRRCGATTRPRRTRRPSASARSGSSRCLPRPRSGTAYAGSASGAC